MNHSPQAGGTVNAYSSPQGPRLMTQAAIILVFASNTEVLNAEDLLEEAELPFELVPVPKEVNPNCGLAISLQKADEGLILAELKKTRCWPQAAYLRDGDDFSPWVLELKKGHLSEA